MNETELIQAVARQQEQIKTLFERMGNLEKLTDSVNKLAISLEQLTGKESATEKQVEGLAEDLKEIKDKPAKRWDTAIAAVISALIGAAIAYFIK